MYSVRKRYQFSIFLKRTENICRQLHSGAADKSLTGGRGDEGDKGGTCHDQSSEVSPGFNIPIIEVEAFHENIFAQENSSSFHKSNIND